MSLATRCTACGTVFRVVQDQLKVSEGWVRCGRCAEVFDAREQLFDLEREAPPPWPRPPEPQPEPEPLDIALDETYVEPETPAAIDPEDAPYPDEQHYVEDAVQASLPPDEPTWEMRANEDGSLAPAVPGDEALPRRFASSQPWPASELPPEPDTADFTATLSNEGRVDTGLLSAATPAITHLAADPDDSPHLPTFVRNAREPKPMSPRQRRLWLGAGALLALLLALQALFHFRDALAAQQPALAGPLKQLCQTLGCEIRPLQRIESLSVEGSSLTRMPNEAGTYRLAVTLRNRADAPLAMPSFELSLSDSAGALLARKVLSPADFAASAPSAGNAAGTIAARGELSLQTQLRAGDARLVGYTVEVFYP